MKKISLFFRLGACGALVLGLIFIAPKFAAAASLPAYRSLIAAQGHGPQVLGTQTGTSDGSLDGVLQSLAQSTDSLYHLPSDSSVLTITPDKSSYAIGDTPSFTISGVSAGDQVAVESITASDILATDNLHNLFAKSTTTANSQGVASVTGRSFTASDSGSWLILAAEVPQGTSVAASGVTYRLGLVRFVVGSASFASMQGYLYDATQGASYTGSFKISVPTTSPLTFIVMTLPQGIKASVPEASFASTTQTNLPLVGQTVIVDNTVPQNGAFTVNLSGTPQSSGVYYILGIVGANDKPLDIDFIKFRVQASGVYTQQPPVQQVVTPVQNQNPSQSISMPSSGSGDTVTLPDGSSFSGLQVPSDYQSLQIPEDQTDTPAAHTSSNVQVEGSTDIWWITDQGMKLKTPNHKIFLSYGNQDEDIITITQDELDSYPNVEYIKLRGTSKIYKISGTVKNLMTQTALNNSEVDDSQVAEVNKAEFSYYKTGKTITK